MGKTKIVVGFIAVVLSAWASAESYTEAWDKWADGATTQYWKRIVSILPTNGNYERLRRTSIHVDHHDHPSAACLQQSNIALSYSENGGYVILVCARQARFLLHFLDSLTTVFLDSDAQADGSSTALAATEFLAKQMSFTRAYEAHIVKALVAEIDKGPVERSQPDFVVYQCGPDYFKMLMDRGENSSRCSGEDEMRRSEETQRWFDSNQGPGGRYSRLIRLTSGTAPTSAEVTKHWNDLHDEVNYSAIRFVLLHEAEHIINGDLENGGQVDGPDRSNGDKEAKADAFAVSYLIREQGQRTSILPIIVAQDTIMYVRYLYENTESHAPSTTETRSRITSLEDYGIGLLKVNNVTAASRDAQRALLTYKSLLDK